MATHKNFREKIADLFKRKSKLAVELAPLPYSRNKRTYKKNTSNRRSTEDERRRESRRRALRKTRELKRKIRESRKRRTRTRTYP